MTFNVDIIGVKFICYPLHTPLYAILLGRNIAGFFFELSGISKCTSSDENSIRRGSFAIGYNDTCLAFGLNRTPDLCASTKLRHPEVLTLFVLWVIRWFKFFTNVISNTNYKIIPRIHFEFHQNVTMICGRTKNLKVWLTQLTNGKSKLCNYHKF